MVLPFDVNFTWGPDGRIRGYLPPPILSA